MKDENEFAWDLLVEEGVEILSPLKSFDLVKRWLEADADASAHLNKMVGIDPVCLSISLKSVA